MYRLSIPYTKPTVREILIKSHWAPGLEDEVDADDDGNINRVCMCACMCELLLDVLYLLLLN